MQLHSLSLHVYVLIYIEGIYMLLGNEITTTIIFHQQRQVFSALSQIAKHSVDLAEMVVEAEIFPAVLTCLKGKLSSFWHHSFSLAHETRKK